MAKHAIMATNDVKNRDITAEGKLLSETLPDGFRGLAL